jgi:hypothetical protein
MLLTLGEPHPSTIRRVSEREDLNSTVAVSPFPMSTSSSSTSKRSFPPSESDYSGNELRAIARNCAQSEQTPDWIRTAESDLAGRSRHFGLAPRNKKPR